MSTVWINGQFVEESAAVVPVRDTGLLHAAGVFTTMRAVAGRIFRVDQHLKRLRNSCEVLFIPLQFKDAELIAALDELLRRDSRSDARIRLTATRGLARQDPLHGLHMQPTVFATATELEPYPADYYQRGMTVVLHDDQKLNPYDIQAGHKTLNYFSRLFALRSANSQQAGEALWFNVHNYLQSGSISNVFIIKDGQIITPPTNEELRDKSVADAVPYAKSAVLPGVTRAAVIEIARDEGIVVKTEAIDVNRLLDADEVFLTNSIMGVMPVSRIERKLVGAGVPGTMTLDVRERYDNSVKS